MLLLQGGSANDRSRRTVFYIFYGIGFADMNKELLLHNNIERIPSSIANYHLLLDAVEELKEKGWSLTKIAKTMKTSQSHLNCLLANSKEIKHDTLKKYMLNLNNFLDD